MSESRNVACVNCHKICREMKNQRPKLALISLERCANTYATTWHKQMSLGVKWIAYIFAP